MSFEDADDLRAMFRGVHSSIVNDPDILARSLRRSRAYWQQRAFREGRDRAIRQEEANEAHRLAQTATRSTARSSLGDVARGLIARVRERELRESVDKFLGQNPCLDPVASLIREFTVGKGK